MLLYTYKMNKNIKSSDFYRCIILENQDFIPASLKKQNQFLWSFATVVYMLKKALYSHTNSLNCLFIQKYLLKADPVPATTASN